MTAQRVMTSPWLSQVTSVSGRQVNDDNSNGVEVSPHSPLLSLHLEYDSSKVDEVSPHLPWLSQIVAVHHLQVNDDNSNGVEVSPH